MQQLFVIVTAAALGTLAHGDVQLELITGDTITGTIVEHTDEQVVIEHSVLGRLAIPRDQIASMPEELADPVPEPAPEAVVPRDRRAASDWESEIDVGISGARGNTEAIDIRAGFLTINESDTHRWRIDAAYYYGETDRDRTRNSATAGVLRDWLFPESPWLVFAQGRYDFDDFRDWTHRASGHGGLGYQFIDTEEFTLIGRLGAGAAKEWKPTEPIRPEGLIGGELVWNISDRQRLAAHTTLYPDLGDFFEFRLVSGVRWTMKLDTARGLALSAGIDNEYESSTDPGIKHNDLKFFAGISLQF